ncbi:hypothetical protein H1W37_00740 [Stappia taiwanensis]|uniref:Uncharacterized protein n=1 Tax=Stappia taiwanensis TaxID=992267 RepID=A0A838XTE3_9HYPH|nr:DUF6352 family protein [Stappia taiwanensis]MBA4610160.1 hypothetical protein [Stappia taiwanensis]GGE77324.1 hypothetical protein GCM10007285_01470 [Stappia taiwanensis]
MRAFWKSSGAHLVSRDGNGWLTVTPDLLRAYVTRPEIHPVEESCPAEHALFEKLMSDPFAGVSEADLAAIADPDAADNYRVLLRFRDHLAAHGTIEGAYAALFGKGAAIVIPPMFIDQMVHLICHNMLRSVTDPLRLRAGELFFREQAVTTGEGQLMLADAEIVETYARTGGLGGLGALLAEAGTPAPSVSLDVIGEENADIYWDRSDRYDTAIDFRFTEPALDAFARVLESWVRHFHGVDVRIQPQQSIRDAKWSWHVGLDAEATRILNGLYEGATIGEADLTRIVALFRLDFERRGDVIDTMRGKPVWLALAMGADDKIRMKPQNLLTNLPLRRGN